MEPLGGQVCFRDVGSAVPGCEQVEGVGGGGGGFGGVEGEGQPGFGDHVDAFVGEFEVADGGVVEPSWCRHRGAGRRGCSSGGGNPSLRVDSSPTRSCSRLVVRVAAGLGAQDGDAGVGGGVPVGVEAVRVVVEEGVAGEVGRRRRWRVS